MPSLQFLQLPYKIRSAVCFLWCCKYFLIRETREGWPLLTFETELNGDSKSTNERGPSLVGWFIGLVTEYIFLQEMKQGLCIYPLSWSVHCNFTGEGKCNERARACTPPSPAWANFTLMMECTPESSVFLLCVLCGAGHALIRDFFPALATLVSPAQKFFSSTYTI